MKRLTKLSGDKGFFVTDKITGKIATEGYYGEAIEKLAKFENFCDHLIARRNSIHSELETLRNEGKTKTVTFKELLTEKMINEMILIQLEKHELILK